MDSGLCQAAPPQDLAGRSQCRYYMRSYNYWLGCWILDYARQHCRMQDLAGRSQCRYYMRSYNYWLGCWILDYARQHRLRIWLAGHSAGIT